MDLQQSFMLWHWAVKKTDRLRYESKMQWAIDAQFLTEDSFTETWEVAMDKTEVQLALLQALNNVALFLLIQPDKRGLLHLSYGGKYEQLKTGSVMEIFTTVRDKDIAPINALLDLTTRLNHMLDNLRTRYPKLYSNHSRFQCVVQYLDKQPLTPTYPLSEYQNISGTLAWWQYGATPTGVKQDPYIAYTYTKPLTLRELKILVYGTELHQLIFKDLVAKKTWSAKTLQKIHPQFPIMLDILNSLEQDGFSLWLKQLNTFLEQKSVPYIDVESSIFA